MKVIISAHPYPAGAGQHSFATVTNTGQTIS